MRQKRQIDVNECIGHIEPLPCQHNTVIAINNPSISLEQVRVKLQILLLRDLAAILLLRQIAACSEFDRIERIKRQPSYRCQTPRKR